MSQPREVGAASTIRRIALVPTYSEYYQAGRAGAFSLFIHETTAHSRFREGIEILGRTTEEPFAGDRFRALRPEGPFWLSRNRRFGWAVWNALRVNPPDLIEVFNRPETFLTIARQAPGQRIALQLGNDPLQMRRARSPRVRAAILKRAAAVFCCSDYIRRKFLDGLDGPSDHVIALYNGARRAGARPTKRRRIAYVGRFIEEKGVLELAGALARLLPSRPDWSAEFVGANRPGTAAAPTPYERAIQEALAPIAGQVTFHGFVASARVSEILSEAAIAVIPSKWEEPMGRTAIEALAAGCAVLASSRGGLPEIVGGRGVLIGEVSASELAGALASLIDDPSRLEALQTAAWHDFPFELSAFVRRYDDLREAAMARPL